MKFLAVPNPALPQSSTHGSPDTDTGPTSLHHTLGLGTNQAALGSHKYHSFANGLYYYDSYSQSNYLRLFIESAAYGTTRFRPISYVEYWDGSAWVAWVGGDVVLENLLDGRPETIAAIDHTHRNFRFVITKASGYPDMALVILQSTWTPIAYTTATVTIEDATSAGGAYTLKETAIFGAGTTGATWGTHMKTSSAMHTGRIYNRVQIDIADWVDSGASVTYPLIAFEMLSNYQGNPQLPFTWDYDKKVALTAATVGGQDVVVTTDPRFNYTNIVAGTDLNTLTTTGTYSQNADVNATTLLNYPVAGRCGILEVVAGYTYQRFTTYKVGLDRVFVRGYFSGAWSAWTELAKTTSPPPAHNQAASTITDFSAAAHAVPAITLSTEDLDLVISPGRYFQPTNTEATALRNYPSLFSGMLEVTGGTGFQRYTTYGGDNAHVFVRAAWSGPIWGSWTELARTIDTRFTDARTPLAHDQTASTITDFSTAADARVVAGITGKANTAHAHAPADVTGTAVITTDSRLDDARIPLAHDQTASTITDFSTAADARVVAGITGKADTAHAHAATDITSGMLSIAQGGTNSASTPTAGGVVYGDGTKQVVTPSGSIYTVLANSSVAATPSFRSLSLLYMKSAWVKEYVYAATVANITLSGEQTIDGVSLFNNTRVLVKNQTDPAQNGIYLCSTGAWTRTTDCATPVYANGAVVNVMEGTANNSTKWSTSMNWQIGNVGIDPMNWFQVMQPIGTTAGTVAAGDDARLGGLRIYTDVDGCPYFE